MLKVIGKDFVGSGLYDPGANASAISLNAIKKFGNIKYLPIKSSYNTTSGKGLVQGITMLDLTINSISKRVPIYVLDTNSSFEYDFIIGLDLIPIFRLSLDYNLNVSQNIDNVQSNVKPTLSKDISRTNVNCNDIMNIERLDEKVSHLDSKKKEVIRNFIFNNSNAFAQHEFDVGNVVKHECRIDLSSSKFVCKKPYRCTLEDQNEIERQVNELLKHNMITESRSPYASPVTLQYKKVGSGPIKEKTRMCVDYRDMNKIIIPENQPFPLIDEIIMKSRGCSWYSALDINLAFWSIPVRPEDRPKTGFITQQGSYEFRSMPFGLKTAPATFQRILSGILRERKLTNFCVNYLDDILVFSHSFEEHIKHLQLLISAIYDEGFRLSFKKCKFAMQTVSYLGHELGPNFVKPMNDNLVAINEFPPPSSRKHVRQFLGKINFYRKFIPNSANLLEPFHNLLRKNVPFSWSSDCQKSFESVKKLLTSAPVLAIFDRTKPTFIYTDASGVGVGAVLKQEQDDGSEKPVAYFSKKLTEAQRKKKAIYIESLAIREAVRFWKYWLLGIHFTVITDHKPLEHLNLKARTDEELGDLAHELLQFDFNVLYRPGTSNSEADCLSRNPVLDPIPELPILRSFNFVSLDDIRASQNLLPKFNPDDEKSGILFRKFRKKMYIVIDPALGEKISKEVHVQFGHPGSKHVMLIVGKHFYFKGMTRIIRDICVSCHICIENKTRRCRRSGKLGFLGPATHPFQIMSLDTIGGFGGYKSTKRYLHLLVDHFTRYAYILCSKGQSARDFISLVDSVQKRHQIGTLLTDQYGGLSSDEFLSYCSSSNIDHLFVAVDCAFSNGLNERLNQTLVNRIRCAMNDGPSSSNWSTVAYKCVSQYNDSPHSVTTFPPSYLLNGCSKNIIPDILVNPPNLTADREIALQNTIKSHNANKLRYDRNRTDISFNIGDYVYIDNGSKLNRSKLDKVRIGPFVISRKLSDLVYEIDVKYGKFSKRLYHASKLLPVKP